MEPDEQLDRFGEAVEKKKEAAREASEQAGEQHPRGSDVSGDQADLVSDARPQDVRSVRDKNSGKGKKTADKWNQ